LGQQSDGLSLSTRGGTSTTIHKYPALIQTTYNTVDTTIIVGFKNLYKIAGAFCLSKQHFYNLNEMRMITCPQCWISKSYLAQYRRNFRAFSVTYFLKLSGLLANQSLKLTENTACFSAARKKLFREMATRAARMRYDDPAARRRSLAPVR
jgi:hypothetical protein